MHWKAHTKGEREQRTETAKTQQQVHTFHVKWLKGEGNIAEGEEQDEEI